MKKILFLIHDLGQGGAEKVLVNLVNNMDTTKFDISVMALFGGGVNEQFLAPHVHYRTVFPKAFPGNSHLMKLLTPMQLHRLCVKERYDIEVSYLESRYPYLKKYPFLLPVAWISRICRFAAKGGSDGAKKTIQLGNERVELLRLYGILDE